MLLFPINEAQAKHKPKAKGKRISSVHHKIGTHANHRSKISGKRISSGQQRKAPAKQLPKENIVDSGQQHTELERNIQIFLSGLRESGKLSRDEMTGWMAYDIAQDKILVNINTDHAFQAASMIKPFVALAFFHQVQQGKLAYTQESRRRMEAMIQRSSNADANWFIRKVGGPSQCNSILRASYGHIFTRTQIREYIPAGGRTYRNTALPSDYIRFLLALWRQKIPYYAEMQRVMALPGRDRLHDGTPIPNGTRVINKTGTTAHLCGDMGILVAHTQNGNPYPYALVGIIERRSKAPDYETWMATRGNIIRHVSTMVYEDLKKQHRLL